MNTWTIVAIIAASLYILVGCFFAYVLSRSSLGSGKASKLQLAKTVVIWPCWFLPRR